MRVRWTTPALRDLENIQDSIAEHDPRAAFDLSERLWVQVNVQLAQYPESGRAGRVNGTRELVISGAPYIVAYRITDIVAVLAIQHTAMRWPDAF